MDTVSIVLYLILLFSLLITVIQDFKHRHISAYLVLMIAFSSFILVTLKTNLSETLLHIFYNIVFSLIQIGCIFIYIKIRYSNKVTVINNYIGIGDILFIVSITPLLALPDFIFIYTFSLIASLCFYFISQFILKTKSNSIPLAGIYAFILMSAFLIRGPEELLIGNPLLN